jgi:chromosome segregation ATPase
MSDESTASRAKPLAKPGNKSVDDEIAELDRQLTKLEAEKVDLPAPVTWDELQEAGALKQIEQAEIRRGVIPRLLRAGREKRLQLQLERLEQKKEPVGQELEKHWSRRERLQEQIQELEAERGQAQHAWSTAHFKMQRLEEQERAARRELREASLEGDDS